MFGAASADTVRYDSHKLYEIHLESGLSPRLRREIDRHIILDHGESQQNSGLTVLVEPHEAPRFETVLNDNNIIHKILVRLLRYIGVLQSYHLNVSFQAYELTKSDR